MNLVAPIFAQARTRAHHPALELWQSGAAPVVQSYAELVQDIQRIAGHLRAAGLGPGDRALMRLADGPEFPKTFLACIQIGVVPIPTSIHLSIVELDRIVTQLRPICSIQDHSVSAASDLRQIPVEQVTAPGGLCKDIQKAHRDDLAYIVMTSGTSGTPRAVAHAHRAIAARQAMWSDWMGLSPTDRVMHAGAFNWTYTLGTGLLDPWGAGATAVIPRHQGAWDALADILDQARPTLFAAVPGVYRQLVKGRLPSLPDLRHGLSAGETLAPSIRADWLAKTQTQIFEAYGMSECSTFLSESPKYGPGLRAQTGRKIQIQHGEIAIQADEPGLMLGYISQTGYSLPLQDGLFHTGDLATCIDDIWTITGRADDMMNAGGYRVHPQEVEDALLACPLIGEAAVTAFSPKADVMIIGAGVVPAPGYCDTDVSAFLDTNLAAYKHPKQIVPLAALPRTANGKLDRRKLRSILESTS